MKLPPWPDKRPAPETPKTDRLTMSETLDLILLLTRECADGLRQVNAKLAEVEIDVKKLRRDLSELNKKMADLRPDPSKSE
jgi:hypothetical protein